METSNTDLKVLNRLGRIKQIGLQSKLIAGDSYPYLHNNLDSPVTKCPQVDPYSI